MHFPITTALVAPFLLSKALAEWSVTIYSSGDNDCGAASSYGVYTSDDPSRCFEAGEPVAGCRWFTDGGATFSDCTRPMTPMGDSFFVSAGSNCGYWLTESGLGENGCGAGGPDGSGSKIFAPASPGGKQGECTTVSDVVKGVPALGRNWYFQCHNF